MISLETLFVLILLIFVVFVLVRLLMMFFYMFRDEFRWMRLRKQRGRRTWQAFFERFPNNQSDERLLRFLFSWAMGNFDIFPDDSIDLVFGVPPMQLLHEIQEDFDCDLFPQENPLESQLQSIRDLVRLLERNEVLREQLASLPEGRFR